ncbi:hypothetical protein BDV96DRAFT_602954 [Lophiotrema nucula]|uniref:Uncharacterized protein n=1 Tax=Lophiotrema nucula TaxID=690887 RepID=A0A6A5YX15_9PLEO|nr:hypothetical protein BDV96DRAFT_602954 [Lophiotrema nucula]
MFSSNRTTEDIQETQYELPSTAFLDPNFFSSITDDIDWDELGRSLEATGDIQAAQYESLGTTNLDPTFPSSITDTANWNETHLSLEATGGIHGAQYEPLGTATLDPNVSSSIFETTNSNEIDPSLGTIPYETTRFGGFDEENFRGSMGMPRLQSFNSISFPNDMSASVPGFSSTSYTTYGALPNTSPFEPSTFYSGSQSRPAQSIPRLPSTSYTTYGASTISSDFQSRSTQSVPELSSNSYTAYGALSNMAPIEASKISSDFQSRPAQSVSYDGNLITPPSARAASSQIKTIDPVSWLECRRIERWLEENSIENRPKGWSPFKNIPKLIRVDKTEIHALGTMQFADRTVNFLLGLETMLSDDERKRELQKLDKKRQEWIEDRVKTLMGEGEVEEEESELDKTATRWGKKLKYDTVEEWLELINSETKAYKKKFGETSEDRGSGESVQKLEGYKDPEWYHRILIERRALQNALRYGGLDGEKLKKWLMDHNCDFEKKRKRKWEEAM